METYERYKKAIDTWEFHGTEAYYRISLSGAVVTDGVLWFAEAFEAYWLINLVDAVRARLENIFIVADVSSTGETAIVKFTDGNDNKVHNDVEVNHTTLPAGDYQLWIANYPGDHVSSKVIYLSTEH